MDIGNAASLIQQSVAQNNAWSAQQAAKQMEFQERMSNTAHQREIADLKASGLNPVLSAKLGGASTPSGAMGSTDTSGTSALVDLLEMAMETANSAAGAAYAAADNNSQSSLLDLIGPTGATSGSDWAKAIDKQEKAALGLANNLISNNPKKPIDYLKTGLGLLIQASVTSGQNNRAKGIVPPAGSSAYNAYQRYTGQSSKLGFGKIGDWFKNLTKSAKTSTRGKF